MSEKNAQPNPDGETPSALDGDEEEEKPPTPPDELWAMLLKACKSGDEGAVKNLIEVEGVVPDHRKIYEEVRPRHPRARRPALLATFGEKTGSLFPLHATDQASREDPRRQSILQGVGASAGPCRRGPKPPTTRKRCT